MAAILGIQGPAKRHLAGKKVFYHKDDFLNWFYNYQSDISRNMRNTTNQLNDNQKYDTNRVQKNLINHELNQYSNLSNVNKLPNANPFFNAVRSHL
jgi:hypothetical protein